jgi:hypothetical protein
MLQSPTQVLYHAMGFSHETTTHHFRHYPSGDSIEVSATDPKNSNSRDQIRTHLSHIVKMFSAGDFNVPMFIHDTTPPGASTMSRLRDRIHYQLEETPQGAKIEVSSKKEEALKAIHDFLRFQISDHKTGDSVEISKQNSTEAPWLLTSAVKMNQAACGGSR